MWYHHCISQPCSTAEQVDMHAIANVVRKCMYLQTHLISPLMHAGIGPLLASAVRTILPYCEGAQSSHADEKGTDVENAIRAVAEALQMVIVVGTGQHAQSYGSQHSTPAWSKCRLWPSLVILVSPGRDLAPQQFPFKSISRSLVSGNCLHMFALIVWGTEHSFKAQSWVYIIFYFSFYSCTFPSTLLLTNPYPPPPPSSTVIQYASCDNLRMCAGVCWSAAQLAKAVMC